MERLVPGYDRKTAPTIMVPSEGHTSSGPNGFVSRDHKGIDNARDLLARDIKELRRVYPDVPVQQLQELVRQNKEKYPDAFKKGKP